MGTGAGGLSLLADAGGPPKKFLRAPQIPRKNFPDFQNLRPPALGGHCKALIAHHSVP